MAAAENRKGFPSGRGRLLPVLGPQLCAPAPPTAGRPKSQPDRGAGFRILRAERAVVKLHPHLQVPRSAQIQVRIGAPKGVYTPGCSIGCPL